MSYKQGYVPSIGRVILRALARIIGRLFWINCNNLFGNIFLQAVNTTVDIKNPIDHSLTLKFKAGHERLFWRIRTTPALERETNAWIDTFEEGEVFIDIGSNIGVYSLAAAQAKKVFAISFELDPINLALQHENIFLNRLEDKIILVPTPLSEKTEIKNAYFKSISPADALHSLDAPSPYIEDDNVGAVLNSRLLTMRLDDLYSAYELPQPSYLKLDVDGTELNILIGARKTLRSIKSLMVEVSSESKRYIFDFLIDQGFQVRDEYAAYTKPGVVNCLFSRRDQIF